MLPRRTSTGDALEFEWIRERVRKREYLVTLHADEERRNDGLELDELEEALLGGSILESYPTDTRGASCLVHGLSRGTPVHIVCGRNRSGWLVIITVYIPRPPRWRTPTERGKS